MNVDEQLFVTSFVLKEKKERILGFLENPKKRNKLLSELCHSRNFDPQFILNIPPGEQHKSAILERLTQKGAGSWSYIISELADLDGKTLLLSDALSSIVGYDMCSIISLIPGKLAYFEGERERFILQKP